nr:transposase [Streptomyces tateyamensis]
MESPLRREAHGGFGERSGETDREQSRHRAPGLLSDEAGFTRRPPRGRTWGRRGITPVVKVSGNRSGRVSVAGLIAVRPGSRTRLFHRIRRRTGRKGERRSLSERDCIGLIDGIHHLVKAPIVLVWDRLNTHVPHAISELVAARNWLTVSILPAYAPDLNPVEWLWAHVKHSLANLSSVAVDRLEALVRKPAQTAPVPPRPSSTASSPGPACPWTCHHHHPETPKPGGRRRRWGCPGRRG